MKIKKATEKDLKEIGKLMLSEFSKPPFNEKASITEVLKSLRFYFKIGNIFVAINDNQIIGIMVVKFEQYWEGEVAIVEDLVVNSKFQSKGIGKKLMENLENGCKRKSVKRILFDTHKDSSALKFYNKIGYKINKNRIQMYKNLK